MMDDNELLRQYARERSEEAFAELVRRHLDVVYGAALRQCGGNAAHAEDAAQLVFTDLARRSASLAGHPALLGWLHTAARFSVMKILRAESRRQAHEQRAAALDLAVGANDPLVDWERLHPVLDVVLGELKDRERTAILLRFFEGKSLQEVGACLRVSETAARSCVDRALDKLRDRLARRGLTSTSAALGVVLANSAAAAAPVGLAGSIAGTAVASAAAMETTVVSLFVMKKILLGIAGVCLVAEFATATIEFKNKRALDADFRALQSASPRPVASPAVRDNTPAQAVAQEGDANNELRELAQLRRRLAELKARPAGVVDSQMRPAANVGRATAQQAMETMAWAVAAGDMETLARYATFTDDTKENREAFMAKFSEAIRARYQTPERLVIAVSFAESLRDPPVAGQIIDSHTYYTGLENVGMWVRYASGREEKKSLPFEESPDGWVLTPLSLTGKNSAANFALPRLDPATGEVLPPRK